MQCHALKPNYGFHPHSLTQKPLDGQTECGVDGTVQRHGGQWVVDYENVVCQCWVMDMQLMGADCIHQKCAAWEIKLFHRNLLPLLERPRMHK